MGLDSLTVTVDRLHPEKLTVVAKKKLDGLDIPGPRLIRKKSSNHSLFFPEAFGEVKKPQKACLTQILKLTNQKSEKGAISTNTGQGDHRLA